MTRLRPTLIITGFLTVGVAVSPAVAAEEKKEEPPAVTAPTEKIEVVATRLPEDPITVPASIQVIRGEELERRQIRTLDQALALAMGVSVAPGGDGGPAGSVPEMMGLREFDAFLLVVDDVPWGGAFNPALGTLDLTNVERIEILRGAAPVMYGATSFVGVINVVHRAAGETAREVRGSGGSYGTWGASGFTSLPSAGKWQQSISAGYDHVGYKDDRTDFDRGHLLYRGGGVFGAGRFRVDFDTTLLDQGPASPHPRVGTTLTDLVPVDANHNPGDAEQDEDRFHLVFGYARPAFGGEWSTTAAFTSSSRESIKGFLREDFDQPPGVANADGFSQTIDESGLYFDTHIARGAGSKVTLVFGVDELYGRGEMDSENFEYHANLNGSSPPDSGSIPIDERPHLEDTRSFAGLYGQMIWSPELRWRIELGARLNVTSEDRVGEVGNGDGGTGAEPRESDSRSDTRGGGSVGVSFRAWGKERDSLWLFADYRDTYKPAAIDFGPEAEGEILEPETAQMIETGVKGINAGGRLGWEVSGFHMDFQNVVVATQVNGLPALENVGEEVFDGVETELSWFFGHDLQAQAAYALHHAKFGDYLADFGGTLQQLDGNRIEMSAEHLASLGVLYLPASRLNASATANYVGSRYLNKRNTALADAYVTWSAGIGYRIGDAELRVDGVNLSDERDPVSESELGDAQYYLMPARTIIATVRFRL